MPPMMPPRLPLPLRHIFAHTLFAIISCHCRAVL